MKARPISDEHFANLEAQAELVSPVNPVVRMLWQVIADLLGELRRVNAERDAEKRRADAAEVRHCSTCRHHCGYQTVDNCRSQMLVDDGEFDEAAWRLQMGKEIPGKA